MTIEFINILLCQCLVSVHIFNKIKLRKDVFHTKFMKFQPVFVYFENSTKKNATTLLTKNFKKKSHVLYTNQELVKCIKFCQMFLSRSRHFGSARKSCRTRYFLTRQVVLRSHLLTKLI